MEQSYKWQIIYLIKFLKEEFPHQNYKNYLFSSLSEILSNVTSPEICVDFLFETDMMPTEILDNLIISSSLSTPPYFLLLRSKHFTAVSGEAMEHQVTLKNTSYPLQVLDIDEDGSGADPEILGNKLSFLQKNITTDNCAVLTWDHGSAYGIFYEPERSRLPIKSFKPREARYKLFDVFSGVTIPKSEQYSFIAPTDPLQISEPAVFRKSPSIKSKSLTMDELALSLSKLKKGKADLLVMINCFMMTIDTQYALRFVVDYLIAPETAIHYQTFQFTNFLNQLSLNPTLSPKDVCKLLIQSIKNNPILTEDDYHEKIAVYTVFLPELNDLQIWKKFNLVCEHLWNNLDNKDFLDQITLKRRTFFTLPLLANLNLSTLRIIDGLSVLKKISMIIYGSDQLKLSINDFCQTYEQSSLLSNVDFYYAGKRTARKEYACKGFSLYFPHSKGDFEKNPFIFLFYNDYNNENLSALAKETFWDNFLYKFYLKL